MFVVERIGNASKSNSSAIMFNLRGIGKQITGFHFTCETENRLNRESCSSISTRQISQEEGIIMGKKKKKKQI